MQYLFIGSGDHLDFAQAELEALFGQSGMQKEDMFFLDLPQDQEQYFSRLAYARKAYRLLFSCKESELVQKIPTFDWNSIIKGTFKVRCNGKADMERTLADTMWLHMKNPKADLKNPDIIIEYTFEKDQVYCGVFLVDTTKNFEERRNKYRPRPHPTGLHPKFARFLVNLSGIKQGTIYDPFCGIGGILLEAGLLGHTLLGSDLSEDMLMRCNENLQFYGIKKYRITCTDSEHITLLADAIVTDVPYGKNSMITHDIEETYTKFLDTAYGKTNRIIAVFPSFSNFRACLGKWKVKQELTNYIHSSLTRHILVLEP
jgi:tRNA (guanine10-N2)-dimethyltransferase